MLETARQFFNSQYPWSAVLYPTTGATVFGLVSIYVTSRIRRPKLALVGYVAEGDRTSRAVRLSVKNQPSFCGFPIKGAAAEAVSAFIVPKQVFPKHYRLCWEGQPGLQTVTIGPGMERELTICQWTRGEHGYRIVDHTGNPVARFGSVETRFKLVLIDRTERKTELSFSVLFDAARLRAQPTIAVHIPPTLRSPFGLLRNAVYRIADAFRFRGV